MSTAEYMFFADRFLQLPDRRTFDLATSEEVWLRIEPDAPTSSEWTERCAALYVRRHPQLVELLDYGPLGRASRFEAFRTHGPLCRWSAGEAEAARALESAATFLAGQRLSAGKLDRLRIINVAGEPRLVADEATGLRLEGPPEPVISLDSQFGRENFRKAGVVLQPRLAIAQIMDFLEEPWPGGTRWLELRAPSGAGASTALQLVAREARLRGFVPISTSLFSRLEGSECGAEVVQRLPAECAGRHVVLLNDHSDELESTDQKTERIVRCILRLCAVVRCPQFAVVSVSDPSGPPTSSWVALDPLTADQLRATISARPSGPQGERRLTCAIRASCGWPGRFLRSLGVLEASHRCAGVARERAPIFAVQTNRGATDATATSRADLDGWKRIVEARGLVLRGRHAAAARTFREAVGMCERRGDELHAGTAGYELGQVCLLRGDLDAARRAFEQAGQRFRSAGATLRAIAATAGEGLARMEAGQLREAEAILRAADLPLARLRHATEGMLVRTALVRCLSWQGRSDEAAALTHRECASCVIPERRTPADPMVNVAEAAEDSGHLAYVASACSAEWHAASARVALQRRALDDAVGHVKTAFAVSRDDQPLGTCAAHTAAVNLHGCIGDADAARLHAARGLDAARTAHAPLEAIRLRISLVIALDQAGARSEARRLAMRLLRLRHRKIPVLLNAELGMALATILPEVTSARSHGEQAEAFARAAGASGLLPVARAPHGVPKPLSDIIDVLRSAEEYQDEADLLERVGQLLRTRLGALTVAFVPADDPETTLVVAGSGRGVGAVRALAAGIVVGPLRTSAGIEIAAPVRCGGATVGALSCRWSAAGPDNADHARALIATTAVVGGSFVKALADRRRVQPPAGDCPDLLGVSPAMTDLRRSIARAAAAPFPVLIVGESGVGKELVARAIHRGSPRRLRNFAALNCAALSEELVESELFGHARGAFTGAIAERRGIFEEADGGTLFLDEVGDLSPRAQAKLLRVLQDGEVRRVGESFARHIDVRVIAATNRTLDAASAEREFRQDLRYRLDVIRIEVPPLRHRIEDIPILAAAFWTRVAPLTGCRATLGAAAIAALVRHDWPGNVRELQNVMSSLVVAAPRRGVVLASALPAAIARCATATAPTTLEAARCAFERRFVAGAVARAGGKTSQAARDLGVTRQGLTKLMKRLGLKGMSNAERRMPNTDADTKKEKPE